jgi:hypothetical protein
VAAGSRRARGRSSGSVAKSVEPLVDRLTADADDAREFGFAVDDAGRPRLADQRDEVAAVARLAE